MVNVNVIGRLGIDAEILDGKRGKFVSFRLAVPDFKDGEKTTTWMRVNYDGDRAIKLAEYLKKGKMVNVQGSEFVSTYTDKAGAVQISRDITAHNIEFVSIGSGQTNSDTATTTSAPPVSTGKLAEPKPVAAPKAIDKPMPTVDTSSSDSDDDLPF
jgi:single-stranded DNA-binding protein